MVNREWGCKPTLAHGWKSPVMPHVRCIGTAGPARCLHFNTGGAVQRSSKSATTFLHRAVQKECRREQRQQTGLPSPWNRPAQHRPIGGILAPRAHRKPLQRQATPFPPGYKTRPSFLEWRGVPWPHARQPYRSLPKQKGAVWPHAVCLMQCSIQHYAGRPRWLFQMVLTQA